MRLVFRGCSEALAWLALAALAGLTVPQSAAAAGIEDTVAGTIGLGRAANYVRVNDFLATWQNPANLSVIDGGDLGAELRLPLLNACFDRARDPRVQYRQPDAESGFMGTESFDNVCNEGSPMPAGNLGWAQSFGSGWGYGIGLFTPAGVGTASYGTNTIVTVNPLPNEQYPVTRTGNESPTRQLLVERESMAAWLMAGLGMSAIPQLRLGISAGVGFASIANTNVNSVLGGSFRDQEVLSKVSAVDWVIPRFVASAVVAPTDSLELMIALTYQADVHAEGHIDLTANGIQGAPRGDCRVADPASPGPNCRAEDVTLDVPFPTLEATLGLRYASRRVARDRVVNPMRDEVWDIEVDAFWAQTSNVDEYKVSISDPTKPGASRITFTSDPTGIPLFTPQSATIPKRWKDTFGARIGGDYNVIASLLALRLGVSYQSSALSGEYMNIDAWPVEKIGLHAGVTVAFGRLKVSAAYAHLFYETVDVGVGAGAIKETVSQMPDAAQAVNEGHYAASLDVISLQSNLAF